MPTAVHGDHTTRRQRLARKSPNHYHLKFGSFVLGWSVGFITTVLSIMWFLEARVVYAALA
jgi:hypothetical protein